MKHAYVFPGQGSQFPGMGKHLYENSAFAKKLFERANEILEFRISDIMFNGTDEELLQTYVTQPAIFLHSVIAFKGIENIRPDMVAGHSQGEFSALVANGVLSFEDGLTLVSARAEAMQHACEKVPSGMAAILGLPDATVEEICDAVQKETGEIVVPANYNCPEQLVISGSLLGIQLASDRAKAAGARKTIPLKVSGAFHSPFMAPASQELREAIEKTTFYNPTCPVYQNVVAKAVVSKDEIKKNLIEQLTEPVKWAQSVRAMIADGASHFTEVGPGKVLHKLIHKIDHEVIMDGVH
jgi:[acyl-carrier-protein] S-malonyltransferase